MSNSGEESKRGRGRPPMEIDLTALERLAELHCNITEAAYVLNVDTRVISRTHREVWDRGLANGKIKLRRAMFRNACEKDNSALQIFLAKNILGMSDNGMNGGDEGILPWDSDEKQ